MTTPAVTVASAYLAATLSSENYPVTTVASVVEPEPAGAGLFAEAGAAEKEPAPAFWYVI